MSKEPDYIKVNKDLWNKRTISHLTSEFYDVPNFVKGVSSLNDIELALLGNVKGKSILHLQCHFGMDSLSLARMGAQVTGVDLSDEAIKSANDLAKKINTAAEFICCDIYDLPDCLDKKFDIVFTSYGTIGWLPDLGKWAAVVSHYLKLGGKFIFVEFHPVVWMFDDGFKKIAYNYFNTGPIIETLHGTYADNKADIHQQSIGWNHGISEVVNSLITSGLSIQQLNEYDYSPYDCFQKTVLVAPKKYRIEPFEDKIPMVYSIVAEKK
jgi:ubiquinone/menaquinone biosynthesis C-methylase UbiE